MTLPLWLRKAAAARSVAGESLHGGPWRPLCEAVREGLGTQDTQLHFSLLGFGLALAWYF